jgi:hypothetical protein
VHITGAGSCTITASQPGDATYNPASDVARTFAISKATQAILLAAISDKRYGDSDFPVIASASSGLPVRLAASSGDNSCALGGGVMHIVGVGLCAVVANQDGNANYFSANTVTQVFNVAKGNQAIAFGALAGKKFGDADFPVSASASSGLPVSFAASGKCTIAGTQVHVTGAGSCTVTASQAGSSLYSAAADLAQTFPIAKASQTITFGPLADKTFGDADFAVGASTSSGLLISFAAAGACTASRTTVHLIRAGTCTVTASQPGDANFEAAQSVSRQFAIAPPRCKVPKVLGKTLIAAKTALKAQHCAAGKVTRAYSKTKEGRVANQGKRPGSVLANGTKVSLVISLGRRP